MRDTVEELGNPRALAAWFEKRASLSASNPAITYEDVTWSYGDLAARVRAASSVFHAQGVRRGDRIGTLCQNRPDVIVCLLAAARLGAIFVPLNFRLTAPELDYVINNAELHTLVVGPEYTDLIEGLRDRLPCKFYAQFGTSHRGFPVYETLLDQAGRAPDRVDVADSDVAALLYTSGTTGKPKGAMVTHGNIWCNNSNWTLAFGFREDDVMLSVAPMFHAGGLFAIMPSVLLTGGHVIVRGAFDPDDYLQTIERYGVTMTFGVPTMILALTQSPVFEQTDLSTLRFVIVGGAPSPESLLRICGRRNIPVAAAYGLTESTSAHTFLETQYALPKINSVGRAVMMGAFRLQDGDGNLITEPHVKAEVQLKGDNIFVGYWRLKDASQEAFTEDGWFRTGDVAYIDEDGFLFVCDRVKDMIISGGENVYPAEVESVVLDHPAVANVAVVAAPDEKWGETVVACVVTKPGASLTYDELEAHCTAQLARYKIPRRLRLMDDLPLNGAGKIQKATLRDLVKQEMETI
ncbi:MAG: AMP-binding protein [Pseudomonadota bacterium]|nr:AMP-binding protein [Pseudomonadota bacterium]